MTFRGLFTALLFFSALAALAACSSTEQAHLTTPSFNTGTVQGTIMNSAGGGITGATVVVTPSNGTALATVTSSAGGAYSVANVPAGGGKVTASGLPAGCTPASPATYSGLEAGGSVTVNIIASCALPTGTVQGTVSSALGGGLGGVGVTVTPGGGVAVSTVRTSSSGAYVVSGVPVGSGMIMLGGLPTGCTQTSPATYSGLASGDSVTVNISVSCTPSTGTVRGNVSSSLGGGLAGVSVMVTPSSGAALLALKTASDGSYSVTNVPVTAGSGTGVVSVSGVPANCEASSANYFGLSAGAAVTLNFVIPCQPVSAIMGMVTSSLGAPLADATVTIWPGGGTALPPVSTSSNGSFAVAAVPVGSGAGVVTVTGLPGNCASATAPYAGLSNAKAVTVNVVVACQPGAITVRTCQTIQTPGSYTLAGSIAGGAANGACLILNASNVVLDCAGYAVVSPGTVLAIEPIQNVVVRHCAFTGSGSGLAAVDVNGATNVAITNSSIIASAASAVGVFVDAAQQFSLADDSIVVTTQHYYAVYLEHTRQAVVSGNEILSVGDAFVEDNSSNVVVSNNTMVEAGYAAALIYLTNGSSNVARANRLNGMWNGDLGSTWGQQGSDDGIVLSNETADTVIANNVANVFDAGFETSGMMVNSVISGNTFTNVGFTGVGAYYGTNWSNNHIVGNRASATPSLAYVDYVGNSLPGLDTVADIVFQNNVISGNSFSSPTALPSEQRFRNVASVVVDFSGLNESSAALPLPFTAANDTIASDTLAYEIPALYVYPTSAFVDDGGNVCDPAKPGNFGSCRGSIATVPLGASASVPRRHMPPPLPVAHVPARPIHVKLSHLRPHPLSGSP